MMNFLSAVVHDLMNFTLELDIIRPISYLLKY